MTTEAGSFARAKAPTPSAQLITALVNKMPFIAEALTENMSRMLYTALRT